MKERVDRQTEVREAHRDHEDTGFIATVPEPSLNQYLVFVLARALGQYEAGKSAPGAAVHIDAVRPNFTGRRAKRKLPGASS